jgi:hypothetical protein
MIGFIYILPECLFCKEFPPRYFTKLTCRLNRFACGLWIHLVLAAEQGNDYNRGQQIGHILRKLIKLTLNEKVNCINQIYSI